MNFFAFGLVWGLVFRPLHSNNFYFKNQLFSSDKNLGSEFKEVLGRTGKKEPSCADGLKIANSVLFPPASNMLGKVRRCNYSPLGSGSRRGVRDSRSGHVGIRVPPRHRPAPGTCPGLPRPPGVRFWISGYKLIYFWRDQVSSLPWHAREGGSAARIFIVCPIISA